MIGWLGLDQQGLSPCKKRQAMLAHPKFFASRKYEGGFILMWNSGTNNLFMGTT
jgi:hypothetical protein